MIQPRQRRLLIVVQLLVAVLAEAHYAIGTSQDLTIGGERFVLASYERRVLQLAELELNQLEPRGPFAVVHAKAIDQLANPL